MSSLIKFITVGTLGGVGILASGFFEVAFPPFIMDVLHRICLAIWSFDGVIDASFLFTDLYYLFWFQLAIFAFVIYKWLSEWITS